MGEKVEELKVGMEEVVEELNFIGSFHLEVGTDINLAVVNMEVEEEYGAEEAEEVGLVLYTKI